MEGIRIIGTGKSAVAYRVEHEGKPLACRRLELKLEPEGLIVAKVECYVEEINMSGLAVVPIPEFLGPMRPVEKFLFRLLLLLRKRFAR